MNKDYLKEYYKKHKEEYKKRAAEYYKQNREKVLDQHKQKKAILTEYLKKYRKTAIGRANMLLQKYNQSDEIYGRGKGDLTAQWIVENIFSQPCHYCRENDWTKIGCDRIDNSKPHTKNNVVPCCKDCNVKRGRKEYNSFI